MSYTDDVVKAKLSALNETQESIVTVAQWIMFHRRYADRTAALWIQKLKDSSTSKRLNLIYLANEVVQQSKARKKDDFLIAFSPIIAEATASAYKGATNEVQQKLKRVVEVWKQRLIFDTPIQESVEARITELDKSKGAGRKPPLLGGSTLSSSSAPSAPPEIQPLIPLQQKITKAASTITGSQEALADYDKLMDPSTEPPSAPVHAARLSALLKKLANAEGAVSESVKARQDLIASLEQLLSSNREALVKEAAEQTDLSTKKDAVEAKKREVEDGILRNLPSESPYPNESNSHGTEDAPNGHREASIEPERPQMEELTPPAAAETPVLLSDDFEPAEPGEEIFGAFRAGTPTPPAGFDFTAPEEPVNDEFVEPSSKKRKLDGGFGGFADDGSRGIEEDVDDLIRAEGGG